MKVVGAKQEVSGVKAWHVGVMVACLVLLSVGAVSGVILYVADRRDDAQTLDQIEACERGNDIRAAVALNTEILGEFAAAAAQVREQGSLDKNSTDEERRRDTEAAVKYRSFVERLVPIEGVICAQLIGRR